MNNPDTNDDDIADRHLLLCQVIEMGLKSEYELHPGLTDTLCILALEQARIAIKQSFGFAKNERIPEHALTKGIIAGCTMIARRWVDESSGRTLADYLKQHEKIRRSVVRHATYGSRGYYEFVKDYV